MVAETLYDVLGVVPAADHNTVVAAYQTGVEIEMHGGDCKGSFWWQPKLEKIAQMTSAMKILVHGDRRESYNRKLAAWGIICSLCQGRGKNEFYGGLQRRTCMACGGSGKAVVEESSDGK